MKKNDSKDLKDSENEKSTSSKKNQSTKKKRGKNFLNSPQFQALLICLIGIFMSLIFWQFVPLKKLESVSNETLPSKEPLTSDSPVTSNSEQTPNETPKPCAPIETETTAKGPKFAMFTRRKDQKNLSVIRKILNLLGYEEVGVEDDWNLLWGFESPLTELRERFLKLRPNETVNHMPGIGAIITKSELSTSGSPFMPPAFRLPKEKDKFLEYAAKYPNKIFVEKNNGHRNVHIRKPKDINLDSNSTFVQEFITNPFLVDGYKFDIGIYTVITSIDPLRLYIYTGDVMFRYCREKFHPFDPNVLEKYVVGDAYRPTWEVPSLIKYFTKLGGGMKASFDAYVRDQGYDPSKIWTQAEEVIRQTVLSRAHTMAEKIKPFKVKNFFELMRVDMLIDTDFKVNLIEANMSPNMHSHRFTHNHIVFEQALYNALQLVGVGSPIYESQNVTRFGNRLVAVTADKNVASNLNECIANGCHNGCEDEECNLCIPCLGDIDYEILAKAQREHIHRADMRRIFPKAIPDVTKFDLAKETKNLTARDKWMTKWFYHKCLYDRSWCQ